LLLLLFSACDTPAIEENKKPNIVFLFADDMTYTAINALGNSNIETPNLDRLVNKGTTFTHAYNMGGWNGAVCLASRAMIISGRYLWRANEFQKNWRQKKQATYQDSWSKLMEKAGYNTYMTGKWHVAAPADTIFQQAKHIRPGMPSYGWGAKGKPANNKNADGKPNRPPGYNRPLSEDDDSWSPTDTQYGGFWKGGKHWSEVLKDDALSFIEDAKGKENPFFMYLAFNAPHDPRQAPQAYMDKYPIDKIEAPKSWLPVYPYKDEIGNSPNLRDEALAPFPRTEYAVKKHIQEYYAIISHLDTQIGEILDALEASGKMDNTYIFFTADHGLSVGKHGLLGKQNMFDHSMRVPFMVMGPDVPQNKKISTDIYLQDVMPTSLELAQIPQPDYVEFNSLLPQIKGSQTKGNYAEIYGAYVNFQRMIRKDGFKLIVYPNAQKILLFDMENDPEEMQNIADLPENKEKVKSLFQDLINLQAKMDDQLDLKPLFSQLN
jgi:arylsulfatase A-like enzyme